MIEANVLYVKANPLFCVQWTDGSATAWRLRYLQNGRSLPSVPVPSVLSLLVFAHSFGEVSGDRSLSGMPEWRVSHIMGKASGWYDGTYLREVDTAIRIFLHKSFRYVITQWTSYAWYFQTMCKSVMYKDTSRKGNTCVLFCSLRKGDEKIKRS